MSRLAAFLALVFGCGSPALDDADTGADAPPCPHRDADADAAPCTLRVRFPSEPDPSLEVSSQCAIVLELSEARLVELWVEGDATIELRGERAIHLGTMRIEAGASQILVDRPTRLHVRDHGPLPPPIRVERSLTWTDPALLDDSSIIGLSRVMRTAASDGHGGRLLAQWFGRFATTAHSERLGPRRMLDAFAADHGEDPNAWDLDALPFVLTGIHHRIDLRDDEHCGELRVSLASTDPRHQPFHEI